MVRRPRTIGILALLLAALVAAGWDACRPEAREAGAQLLRYVPADTAFFAGITEGAWARELGAGSGLYRYVLEQVGGDPREMAGAHGPAAGVLAALLHAQQAAAERGERPLAIHGVPANAVMAAYTVGQTPVLRWELADPRAFWQSVDGAERRAGVSGRRVRHAEAEARRYRFEVPGPPLELVLAAGEGFAVAALHAPEDERADLTEVLGLERPAGPLDPAMLEDLARSFALVPGTAAFIDNERLLAPLSEGASQALVGRVARIIESTDLPLHPWVEALGTAACRDALALLPDYWSRTVVGTTSFDSAARRVEQRVVFETPHQRGLAALESLQGRIPALTRAPQTVVGIGLGIDLDEWVSADQTGSGEGQSETEDAAGDEASDAPSERSDCAPIASVQSRRSGEAPPSAVVRLLTRTEGVGASVFRTPPSRGRGQRPGAASAVMVTTSEPDAVRAALWDVAALSPADPGAGSTPPWRSVRRSIEEPPGQGLLLSNAPVVLPQPPADSEDAAATDALATVRFRHGVGARATVAAIEPWLAPLSAAQRDSVRDLVRAAHRLPFDLALDVRVGDTGIELDLGVAPAHPRSDP